MGYKSCLHHLYIIIHIDLLPFQLKQPLIRSQFACTYKDDQIIKPKNQPFSLSPVLTNVYPALQKTADSHTEDRSTSGKFSQQYLSTSLPPHLLTRLNVYAIS